MRKNFRASESSEHVMAFLAFWGLLFCFGIILLLVVSAVLIVLVGPSCVYLGDHWASDVLGSYLIGGALLGVTLWLYLNLKARGVLGLKRNEKWEERKDRVRASHAPDALESL